MARRLDRATASGRRTPLRERGLLLAALFLLVSACAARPPGFYAVSTLVRGASASGEVRTTDYVLYFRYELESGGGTGEAMQFRGDLEPRPGLDVLDIRLHLLDQRNVVLATHLLHMPGAFGGVSGTTVRQRFPVPPGAAFLAFSHYAHEDTRRILRDDDRRWRRW